MSVRTWPIRSRLLALVALPIACLVLFWSFANYLTFGDGLRLYNQGTLNDQVAVPAQAIVRAMQEERRTSMVYLAAPSTAHHGAVTDARRAVDGKIAAYRRNLGKGTVRRVASDRIMSLAHDESSKLNGLSGLRTAVDDRRISRDQWMSEVTDLLDGFAALYSEVTTFPDESITVRQRSLQQLARAREMRSREDAVLAGALADGRFTGDSYRSFVQAVGVKDSAYHETTVGLTGQDRKAFTNLVEQDPFHELAAMEKSALKKGGAGRPVPVNATQWRLANRAALDDLYSFEHRLGNSLVQDAKTPSYWIFARLAIAFLLGAVAIVASVLVARRLSRSFAHELRGLRDSARDLAWVRLPSVVERLSVGKSVDVDAEIPTLPAGGDEIGQVSEAFNEVGRTAVRAATEQAELRAGVSNVFLNIARRSQTLLQRQISHLDVMERKAAEPEALEDLFRIDHLATRMRRNAENLVILSGGQAGRQWNKPVRLQDVLRSAASEVEQYERVKVVQFPPVLLAGSVVSDIVHLAAELIDNATAFSPPHTRVTVTGQSVPKGFAVEVEDRGLGMSPEALEAANAWLSHPPQFDVLALSDNARLGMFVVARIAARHEVRVHLRGSPYGGTTAIMLLPTELVAESDESDQLVALDAERAPVPEDADAAQPSAGKPSAVRSDAVQSDAAQPLNAGAADPTESGGWPRLTALPDAPEPEVAPSARIHPITPGESVPEPARYDQTGFGPRTDAPARPADPDGGPQREARSAAHRHPASAHAAGGGEEDLPPLPTRSRSRARPSGAPAGEASASIPVADAGQPSEPPGGAVREGDTHMGLPKRVRQANLAPGLRKDSSAPAAAQPDTAARPERTPDEIRKMMSSYQRGTVEGRASSAQVDGEAGEGPAFGAQAHASTNQTTVEVGKEDGS